MKRRDILKAGGGSIALAGLWGAMAPAAASTFAWKSSAIKPLLGQTFWLLHPEQGARAFVLYGSRRPAGIKHNPYHDQFTLIFTSPGPAMEAGTFEMDNSTTGRFSLHVSPNSPGPRNTRFHAHFSLWLTDAGGSRQGIADKASPVSRNR
jgi:hypothetical protein